MARHVELGDHANSAIARIPNDIADLLLRVVLPVRALLLQQGNDFAFDAETLVFREMPVKDVELDGFHPVEISLDHIDRHEVAAGVDHEPAPLEARLIVNRDRR